MVFVFLFRKSFWICFSFVGDENKFISNSTTFDQTPNEQTENIFMTEVCSREGIDLCF
jgi:hypothetical protein